jgi:hypothetical protein
VKERGIDVSLCRGVLQSVSLQAQNGKRIADPAVLDLRPFHPDLSPTGTYSGQLSNSRIARFQIKLHHALLLFQVPASSRQLMDMIWRTKEPEMDLSITSENCFDSHMMARTRYESNLHRTFFHGSVTMNSLVF